MRLDTVFRVSRVNQVVIKLRDYDEQIDGAMMAAVREDSGTQLDLFGPGLLLPEPVNNWVHFTIVNANTGEAYGFVQMINVVDGSAEIGACIAPAHRHHGYGQQAVKALHQYAHDMVGVRKLRARIFVTNKSALQMCGALGYKQTGVTQVPGYDDIAVLERELP